MVEQTTTETEVKVETAEPDKVEEQPAQKIKCILGIDPAFKNCGFGLIEQTTGKYVASE